MEPRSSAPQDIQDPGNTRYTVSLTARACLQALRLAAWIEAMLQAHRATQPQGAGSWLWFLVRCALFTFGAYAAVGVMAELTKRRAARGKATLTPGNQAPQEGQHWFDLPAYEATVSALLFHFGAPLWMWIFE
jgi:hypothetical protein